MPITYVILGLLLRKKDFLTPLKQANKMVFRLLVIVLFFIKKEAFKTFIKFFQIICNYSTAQVQHRTCSDSHNYSKQKVIKKWEWYLF